MNQPLDGWIEFKKQQPEIGQLCIVMFYLYISCVTGETRGPIAVAYWDSDGWIMADEPTPLRGLLGNVGPSHWKELRP